jgi:hypothetical protein
MKTGTEISLLNSLLVEQRHINFMVKTTYAYRGDAVSLIIPYKDARTDMDILDSVLGPQFWQNRYKRSSNGTLECGIGILTADGWLWKWSNGVPSNFEQDKGEYSDAFKRAGYMWGIGRCLYTFPQLKVNHNDTEWSEDSQGRPKVKASFKPDAWRWEFEARENDQGAEYYHRVRGVQYIGGKPIVRIDTNPGDAKSPTRDFKTR